MKALTRLQSTVLFQAAENEGVAAKMTQRAKQFVAFGVLVSAALASQGAHAQNQVLTPSNCAGVGATVAGIAGAASGKTNVQQAVWGALGALGGAAAGNWLCSPKTRSLDSSYDNAARYGVGDGRSVEVDRQSPKMSLSITERDRLDEMSGAAINAKYAWKKSLFDIDHASQRGYAAGVNAAREQEAINRAEFERARGAFAGTVARLNAGADGSPPRAVGRYLEISASLLELDAGSRVSYQMLEQRDTMLKDRSPAYQQEADRVGRMRALRG